MKNKAVKLGIFATIVPRIFCCGLPIALALIGLVAPDTAHFHLIPHEWEPILFMVSGLMLCLSWWLILRDCGCECSECGGGHAHRTQKIIMWVVTALFILSVILHLISHH